MIYFENSERYKSDSVHKNMKYVIERGGNLSNITIQNEDICSEEFELTESLCSSSSIVVGSCEASCFKTRIANINSKLKGFNITVSETLDDSTNIFVYGKYKIESDKPTADRVWRDIVAYDSMYEIINTDVTEWYLSYFEINPEVKMSKFIEDFLLVRFSHLFSPNKIKYPSGNLINRNFSVRKSLTGESPIYGKQIINAICEFNGCFGRIDRKGNFEFLYLSPLDEGLYPSETLYPKDSLYPKESTDELIGTKYFSGSCKYEDFTIKKIDGVMLVKKDQDNDIRIYSGSVSAENTYVITNNIFVLDKSDEEMSEIAQNIADMLSVIEYTPFEVSTIGNPCIETGDTVRIIANSNVVDSYILNRTIKGIQGKKDTYKSDGTEYIEQNNPSSNAQNMLMDVVRNTKIELTDYQKQAINNSRLMAQAVGYYSSVETDEQGRTITYWHNKPNKSDSTVIWKFSIDGIFIWTANDPYYVNAFTSDGTLTMKTIYAMGVSADFIKGGTLEIGGTSFNKDGKILVKNSSGNILITLDKNGIKFTNGQTISWDDVSDKDEVVTDRNKTTKIGKDYIDTLKVIAGSVKAENIDTSNAKISTAQIDNLVVGSNVTMGSNATITWNNVTNQPTIPTDVNQLSDSSGQKWSTEVGNTWIKTSSVYAQNLQVNSAKINGKITASQINADNLHVKSANIDGSIIGKAFYSVQDGTNWYGPCLTDDAIWFDQIRYGRLFYIGMYNGRAYVQFGDSCRIDALGGMDIAAGYDLTFSESMYISAKSDDGKSYSNVLQMYYPGWSGLVYKARTTTGYQSNLISSLDGDITLGTASKRFGQIYSTNSAISTSDRREKENISYIGKEEEYETFISDEKICDFVNGLKPVVYNLKDGTSGRPHHGFIAQDIEELLSDVGIEDHAGFIKSPRQKEISIEKTIINDKGEEETVNELEFEDIPDEYRYSLRYEEFIADLTRYSQIQAQRINELESELSDLKNLLKQKGVI